MDRNNQDYFQEEEMQYYYQSAQAITGSQIIRAYGVPPIYEAPSNEEITMRHIDSHLSNFARGDNRHLSQGFSNMSNILTPKVQHRTVNDIHSLVILPNKKDQTSSTNNLQTSIQIISQQQNSQTVLPNISSTKQPAQQAASEYNPQPSNFSSGQNFKVLLTDDDNIDSQLQDSSRQKTISQSQQPQINQSQLPQQNQQQQTLQLQQQQSQNSQQQEKTTQAVSTNAANPQSMQVSVLDTNKVAAAVKLTNRSETLFQNKPVKMMCPFCAKNISTQVIYTPSCKTHLMSVGLGLIGFICGLCLIPYYFQDKFQTAVHSCPNCKKEIGRCEY